MSLLKNKTILVISPQYWGKVLLSKHHYALELAEMGNIVFYLNPVDMVRTGRKESIKITSVTEHPNLFLVDHRLFFPFEIKFHAMGVFHFLMKLHVKRLMEKIDRTFDIIWSFDLGDFFPFRLFPPAFKIFHPVDEPLFKAAIDAANDADILFSVTPEILEKYAFMDIPSYIIQHGISNEFIRVLQPIESRDNKVHVGLSGNLTRKDIDWLVLVQIIEEHPDVVFEFWGPYDSSQSNIGSNAGEQFQGIINTLQQKQNVILHGAVSPAQLASEFRRIDIFLICYDILKDQSKGTNYHKVLEYLSTGKVVVSNNITSYHDKPGLIEMVEDRDHNSNLPALFQKVKQNLHMYNAVESQEQRKAWALQNTYEKQLNKIENHLKNMIVPSKLSAIL